MNSVSDAEKAAKINRTGTIIAALIAGIFLLLSIIFKASLDSSEKEVKKLRKEFDVYKKGTIELLEEYFDTVEKDMPFERALENIHEDLLKIQMENENLKSDNAKLNDEKQAAYDIGYNEGLNVGDDKLKEEYDRGYTEGKNDGYKEGYDKGVKSISTIATSPNDVNSSNYMTDICPAYQKSESGYYKEYSAVKSGNVAKFSMGGDNYVNGFTFADKSWAVYNLKGQYKSLTGVICHVDGTASYSATLRIFFDNILKEEFELTPDMAPIQLNLNVTDVKQIKFENVYNAHAATYGIGNPILK